MHLPNITQSKAASSAPFHFFILSHGMNAGKPLKQACPNCFLVVCNTQDECNYWYWLCWGLWKSKKFEWFIRGSVIPFVRIIDIQQALSKYGRTGDSDFPALVLKAVDTMKQIEEYEATAKKKIELLQTAKMAVFTKILRS